MPAPAPEEGVNKAGGHQCEAPAAPLCGEEGRQTLRSSPGGWAEKAVCLRCTVRPWRRSHSGSWQSREGAREKPCEQGLVRPR